jgi:LysR family transcriptional regulator, low CO2-responsive transcriptional regulator
MADGVGKGVAMPRSDIRRYLKHGTLPQLRVFEATARLGSLARAAEELHIAQPTASVQIRKLSETVGLPLFEQVGRRIYLTEAGKRVVAGCDDVFHALSRLEEMLADMRGLFSGRLQLAVTSMARHFAPRLLGAFSELHPGIETSLQVHNRSTLIERLANNEDDLYMFAHPPERREVVVQAILSNPLVVVARSDHPLAGRRNVPFARLAQEPFLMRETGSGTRMVTLELFGRHGLTPRIRMELSSNEAIQEAILAGLGISILSRYTLGLEPEETRLTCLDVEGFPLENQWHFVYPVGKHLSVAARAFLDFARAEARRLALDGFEQRPAEREREAVTK